MKHYNQTTVSPLTDDAVIVSIYHYPLTTGFTSLTPAFSVRGLQKACMFPACYDILGINDKSAVPSST